MIRLLEDGDRLAANISWPPHLTNTSSNFLQNVKLALQRTHDNSDNYGVQTVNEVRKIGNLFYELNVALYSDVMYILEGNEIINQYESVAYFISKNFREAAIYVNFHIGVGD
jgi:hypothetical protein